MIAAPARPRTAKKPKMTEEDLIASICRESFYEFVKEFWHEVISEVPVWNWHIKYLCDQLQEAAERVFRGEKKLHDIICNIPPGTSKSTIFSIMFPAWVWTRMPSAKFICGSYSERLALDLSRKCRDVITSEKYRRVFPNVVLRDDQNTKGHFANTNRGIRYCVGVGGSVIGMHGHFIIIDDPIDPMAVASQAELDEANRWCSNQVSQRKVDKRTAVTMLVMQRLHPEDPTADRLNKKEAGKVLHICLPAELSDKINPKELADYYEDGLLDPVRLDRDVLTEAMEILMSGYSGQFMQDPTGEGCTTFDVSKLHIVDSPPERFKEEIRYWDKAGTAGAGKRTAGVKMAEDLDGRFWVLDVQLGQWESFTRERRIRDTAKTDGKRCRIKVEQEPGSGGKESAENTIRGLPGYLVYADRVTGDKETRADPFACQVNGGNVWLVKAHWNKAYIDELRHFPKYRFKDQVDASSGGFAHLYRKKKRVGGFGRLKARR